MNFLFFYENMYTFNIIPIENIDGYISKNLNKIILKITQFRQEHK